MRRAKGLVGCILGAAAISRLVLACTDSPSNGNDRDGLGGEAAGGRGDGANAPATGGIATAGREAASDPGADDGAGADGSAGEDTIGGMGASGAGQEGGSAGVSSGTSGSASGGSDAGGDGGDPSAGGNGGASGRGCEWVSDQQLLAADGAAEDSFASALAAHGDTVLVGAPNRTYRGAAYVFVRRGGLWTPEGPALVPSDDSNYSAGRSVALSGDIALVGGSAAAFVFVRADGVWMEEATLRSSDNAMAASNGFLVAVSGDTALVGAPDTTVGTNQLQGAAYVFVRSANAWTQQGPALVVDDPGVFKLGLSVTISGDTALIGSMNGAYVFSRSGTTWSQQGPALVNAGPNSVALDGDRAIVTLRSYPRVGSAHVFARHESVWTEQRPALVSPSNWPGNSFGHAIAITGNLAAIGDPSRSVGRNEFQGAASVFSGDPVGWSEFGSALTDPNGNEDDFFGMSVAASEDTVFVGTGWKAIGANVNQGAALVFKRPECDAR